MTNPNTAGVLYYPHTEFYDSTWLKAAICIWERVYRIVPPSYKPQDSDDVKQARDAGVLVNISPTERDLRSAAEEYTAFVEDLGDALPAALVPDGEAETATWTRVHPEKIDAQLFEDLHQLIGNYIRDGDWLRLPPRTANGYLLHLADSMAKRRCLAKATDSKELFVAMQYFAQASPVEDAIPLEGDEAVVAMIAQHILPRGLEHAAMQDVLAFRERTTEGRAAFRDALTTYSRHLSSIEDDQHLEDLVHRFGETLVPIQQRLADEITRVGREPVRLGIALAIPITIEAIKYFVQPSRGFDSATLAAFLGLTAIGTLANTVLVANARKEAPAGTYLVDLRQQYGAGAGVPLHLPAFNRLMEEFIND